MRILILTPWQPQATGNHVTALRHQLTLQSRGHEVRILEVRLEDSERLGRELITFRPEIVHLLHAWRSGLPWASCAQASGLPFVVTLTGTDIHEGIHTPSEAPIIEKILAQASSIITQNPLTEDALRVTRPDLSPRLNFLPPGILLGNRPYSLRKKHGFSGEDFIFFHPASIRPVKANLELLELLERLRPELPSFHVAFCGPILDSEYGARFRNALHPLPWAHYLGVIPPEAMPAALQEVNVVLNHSFNEGLPNVLIEAIALGRPILARDIPGNRAVVEPGQNGFLYSDDAEFIQFSRSLTMEEDRVKQLSSSQPERFSPEKEATHLERIYQEALLVSKSSGGAEMAHRVY